MYKTLRQPPRAAPEIIKVNKLLLTRSSSQNPPPAPRAAEIIMMNKLLTNGMAEVDVACVRFPRRIGP